MKGIRVFFGMGFGIYTLTSAGLQAQQPMTALYKFNSVTISSGTVDPTPVPVVPGILCGSFSAVGYTGNSAAATVFSWTGNDLGGIRYDDNFDDYTGSLNEGKYFEVTLAPQPGYSLELDSISFVMSRANSGVRNYAVRSSIDGFAANLPVCINPLNAELGVGPDNTFRWLHDTADPSLQKGSEVLLGDDFAGLSSPITFRFYGWNAESSNGRFTIDNVNFSGSIEPVPEVRSSLLLAFAGALLVLKGRRRIQTGRGGES